MSSFRIVEHTVPCSYIREFPRGLAGDQEDTLHLAVKQYIPVDNPNPRPGDVTIVATHANGFPKELYEPLWEDLLSRCKKHNFRIRSIWMADVAQQGASSVLNENKLGNDPGWFDHPRDLIHLINLKRKEMPRPIIGIGHSMGGAQLVQMALWSPRLFTTLLLLDPVIQTRSAELNQGGSPPNVAQLSTFRRDVWPSRREAAKAFLKSPFYQAWDNRVFDRWIAHGLRDLPTPSHPQTQKAGAEPQVTLTTTVANEVHTFLRPNYEGYGSKTGKMNRTSHPDLDPNNDTTYPFYRSEAPRTFARLPEVRPSVCYVFGGLSTTSTPEMNEAKLNTTGVGVGGSGGHAEGRVKAVTLEDAGHLVAMEAVAIEPTADICADWIGTELERWRDEEEKHRKEWIENGKSAIEKSGLDEQWRRMMGGPPKRPKKESKM